MSINTFSFQKRKKALGHLTVLIYHRAPSALLTLTSSITAYQCRQRAVWRLYGGGVTGDGAVIDAGIRAVCHIDLAQSPLSECDGLI